MEGKCVKLFTETCILPDQFVRLNRQRHSGRDDVLANNAISQWKQLRPQSGEKVFWARHQTPKKLVTTISDTTDNAIRETVRLTTQEIIFQFQRTAETESAFSSSHESTHLQTKCHSQSFSNLLKALFSNLLKVISAICWKRLCQMCLQNCLKH